MGREGKSEEERERKRKRKKRPTAPLGALRRGHRATAGEARGRAVEPGLKALRPSAGVGATRRLGGSSLTGRPLRRRWRHTDPGAGSPARSPEVDRGLRSAGALGDLARDRRPSLGSGRAPSRPLLRPPRSLPQKCCGRPCPPSHRARTQRLAGLPASRRTRTPINTGATRRGLRERLVQHILMGKKGAATLGGGADCGPLGGARHRARARDCAQVCSGGRRRPRLDRHIPRKDCRRESPPRLDSPVRGAASGTVGLTSACAGTCRRGKWGRRPVLGLPQRLAAVLRAIGLGRRPTSPGSGDVLPVHASATLCATVAPALSGATQPKSRAEGEACKVATHERRGVL